MMTTLAALVILLPGVGALLAAVAGYGWPWVERLLGRRLSFGADQVAMTITSTCVVAAALFAWHVFMMLVTGVWQPGGETWLTWLTLPSAGGGWQVSFGCTVDMLSATMLMVVATVSACVHIYSVGYMEEDPSRRRFFIYLSIFTVSMNLLVSAPNLLQMFLGWEGVGVCSYLLIGFWYHKPSANAAAMKAFIVNRISDVAMLVGLFLILSVFGTLNYTEIFPRIPEYLMGAPASSLHPSPFTLHPQQIVDLIALLLFIGAMGKSAQFGLHVWLPDAMEGPTPVSALIHAATMVTAGVFLLCRLSPLYELAPSVLHIVGWVGALTAIFAATVGLTQPDIKKVIAYSTCSQLGYMFFAIGVSAYPAAMFHLTTHAFFKALLFLGAGSVIHALHHEQNIFKMGGLKTLLPTTYVLMWVGSLALAGIPPFAGFFSKDLILESAFMAPGGQGYWLYLAGTLGAFLTAFYSFRVLYVAFEGKLKNLPAPHRHNQETHHAVVDENTAAEDSSDPQILRSSDPQTLHPDYTLPPENGWLLGPLVPLASGALAAGLLLGGMADTEWWQGAITVSPAHTGLEASHHTPFIFKYLPLLLAVGGILLARFLYVKRRNKVKELAQKLAPLHAFSLNKWYIDELYEAVIVKPTAVLARQLARVVDAGIIDGIVNGTAHTVRDFGLSLRQAQTGYVYHYAFAMLFGLVFCLALILWRGA